MTKTDLAQALKPILDFIDTNDSDTLGMIERDERIVAIASGSWSADAPITLGDLRKLRKIWIEYAKAN